MLINPRKGHVDLHMKLYNKDLENVYRYNYFGMSIDDTLTFNDFVDNQYNKTHIILVDLDQLEDQGKP